MPFYTSTTQDGVLSPEQKQIISEEITRIHCAATGAPRNFVRVIFLTYPQGSGYSGGAPGPLAVLSGEIRAGRDIAVKQKMLTEFWEMYARVTGSPKDQMLVILKDVPASQVMEFAAILPEPGEETAWLSANAN